MLKRKIAMVSGAALCAALLCSGCKDMGMKPANSASPAEPAPLQVKPLSDTADASSPSSSKTPLRDSIVALLERDAKTFPAGTRLMSVKLEEGVASLDFSAEFNGLANMGESGESVAQQKLQATLAAFPNVEKMRVTVEGRPFESQATDWNTPFPVRRAGGRRSDSRSGGAEHGDRP